MVNSPTKRIFGQSSNTGTEIIAGATTFLTMAYIVVVNPQILSAAGMDKNSLIAVTCLVSGLATLLTGLLANAPIAMAPGMGLNAFFAYTLVMQQKIPWPVALGIVFLSGLFFLLLTWLGLRRKLVAAIPPDLLHAIAVGIGLFITFIGLQNLGLVVRNETTMVAAGQLTPTVLIGLVGLLIMIVLEIQHIRGTLLIGIFFTTLLAIIFGYTQLPRQIVSWPGNMSLLIGKIDILGALKLSLLAPIFTLMFMDLFDSLGTLLACTQQAGMVDSVGHIPRLNRLLGLDAAATMFGAVCGTSTTTAYIESAAGIASGGRSGLTAVTTGLLLLATMFFVPLLAIVPNFATAPALIMVGYFMMRNISHIDLSKPETAFPSYIIMILIALSYSISTGLAFGFLSYSLIKIARGKWREIKPTLWLINALCLIFFMV